MFFDNIDHDWMVKFLEHHIADKRIIRLIAQCLRAGVSIGSKLERIDKGCPQGAVISPLLANIYLHYVIDLWVKGYRKKKARGEIVVVT